MMAKAKAEVTNVPVHEQEIKTGELAAIIGKSSRWVRQLVTDGVLKTSGHGKFKLSEAIQSYIEHASGGKEDDGKPRYIDHRTEHERIKTEKALLELEEMRGTLHRAEDVEAVMNDMLGAFRQRIRAVPMRVAPDLLGQSDLNVVKGKLKRALDEALLELSNYDPERFREERTRTDSDAET